MPSNLNISLCALLVAASVSLPAAAAGPPTAARCEARRYVDASSHIQGEAQIEAWYTLVRDLRRDFDHICGDTFCEGEYSNIESLGFRCSVDAVSGQLGSCVWLFAASLEEIDPASGKITSQPKFWTCRVPLAADTTLDELLGALAGASPLHARLPRSEGSIYDGLVDCL